MGSGTQCQTPVLHAAATPVLRATATAMLADTGSLLHFSQTKVEVTFV
jgi:hypothetical protein